VRRATILVGALALVATGCGNLGLGKVDCIEPQRDISAANILTVQAVPTAKYTPCINELRLSWDTVEWFAEDGRAGIEVSRAISPFLTVTVTESCSVSGIRVESELIDIEQYVDVDFETSRVDITIVPSGEAPLAAALDLADRFAGFDMDNRPVSYTVDDAIGEPVGSRVDAALAAGEYVWIIDEVDAEEGTVQLRSNIAAATGRGLRPGDAFDLVEDALPGVFYKGEWYFTFEGGCITYEFDATGRVAETIAADAKEAFGFYPASELREWARDSGYRIELEE
jgi:hypothetical protein